MRESRVSNAIHYSHQLQANQDYKLSRKRRLLMLIHFGGEVFKDLQCGACTVLFVMERGHT